MIIKAHLRVMKPLKSNRLKITSEDVFMKCDFDGDGVTLEEVLLGVTGCCISLPTLKMLKSVAEVSFEYEYSDSFSHCGTGV